LTAVPLAVRLSPQVARFSQAMPEAVLAAATTLGVPDRLALITVEEMVTRVLVAIDALYAEQLKLLRVLRHIVLQDRVPRALAQRRSSRGYGWALPETRPVRRRIEHAVLLDRAAEFKEPRPGPKVEEPVQPEPAGLGLGEAHLVGGDEKRRPLAEGGGLYLDEALSTVTLERKNVVPQAVTPCLGHMFHTVSQLADAELDQAPPLELDGEVFPGQAQGSVP
jgi:hypothetical protein